LAAVPRTAILCCPSCYRMISYTRDQLIVSCDACGHSFPQSAPSSN
jgi:ribosomal protein L37AE/L43A